MPVFRYIAHSSTGIRQAGELAGSSAAEVRQRLRALNLVIADVRPVRRAQSLGSPRLSSALRDALHSRARRMTSRRRDAAEMLDGLATLLESGLPALEAMQTLASSAVNAKRRRTMLIDIAESLRSGGSLGQALAAFPDWFAPADVAMIESAQHSGRLESVLRSIAERLERAEHVRHRLVAAVMYPALVACVGLGATVFLGSTTLPELAAILKAAGAEVPATSLAVIAIGSFIRDHVVGLALVTACLALAPLLATIVLKLHPQLAGGLTLAPGWMRRLAFARICAQLAEMLRAGVPLVDAMRILAPATSLPSLRTLLESAAAKIEHGDDIATALTDPRYVTDEFRRLLELGQTDGELDALLDRASVRAERQAMRLLDRVATLVEPALILLLAAVIGLVVMAALLPILRLQEVV